MQYYKLYIKIIYKKLYKLYIIQSHNHQNSKDSVIVNKFSDLH